MEILLKEEETRGAAIARMNDVVAGKMTYSIASSELIIIDHTEVNPSFKGQNVGKQMLNKIVEMAREKKIKIIPLCPFAASMFKKSVELNDVLK